MQGASERSFDSAALRSGFRLAAQTPPSSLKLGAQAGLTPLTIHIENPKALYWAKKAPAEAGALINSNRGLELQFQRELQLARRAGVAGWEARAADG
jgi:hypothetical protein